MNTVTNLETALAQGARVQILDKEITFRRPKIKELSIISREAGEVIWKLSSLDGDIKNMFGTIGESIDKISGIIPYFTELKAEEIPELEADYLEPIIEEVIRRNKDFFVRALSRAKASLSVMNSIGERVSKE